MTEVKSFGKWTKMTRKERKKSRKDMDKHIAFYNANRDKECELCGSGIGTCALFEVHQIMDSKNVYDGATRLLCHDCMTGKDFIEFWHALFTKVKGEE